MQLRTRSQWWGVVLDAPDARELARFYARLLGWQLFLDPDGDGVPLWASVRGSWTRGSGDECYVRQPLFEIMGGGA